LLYIRQLRPTLILLTECVVTANTKVDKKTVLSQGNRTKQRVFANMKMKTLESVANRKNLKNGNKAERRKGMTIAKMKSIY